MRFVIFAAAALALCGPASAQVAMVLSPEAEKATVSQERIELPASNGRKLPVTIWKGAGSGPVVIFNHVLGGAPENYRGLLEFWAKTGLTVIAPIEPDSLANPGHSKVDLPTGFGLRTEDLMIVRGFVAAKYPKSAVFLAGHSYGSLFAMMGGGAVTAAGPLPGPPVAGIVAFSTPGMIQGVVKPETFASVKVPMVVFTGTNDTVPGFVPNAADHRIAFDTAPAGDKMLVTFNDAGHDLVIRDSDAFRMAAGLSVAFFEAYGQNDATLKAELRGMKSSPIFTVEHR